MNPSIDPATLKITDLRFADIDGAPKRCTLLKIYTRGLSVTGRSGTLPARPTL